MALICVTCGSESPATNHFCGQCGTQLARAAGDPEEFPQTRAASAGLAATSALVGESEQLRDRRGEAPRWNSAATTSTADVGVNSGEATPANSAPTEPDGKYRFVIERENNAQSGFLGLSQGVYGYDDEEPEPSSPLLRNIAVGVVAVAVCLMGWQWRTIRDYGLLLYSSRSGHNGFKEAAPANTGLPNSSAPIAEYNSRALAKADDPQPTAASSATDDDRAVQRTGRMFGSAAGATTSTPSADAIRPRAMGSPIADGRESQSSVLSNQRTALRPSRNAEPAANLPRNPLAGAYEMNRAAQETNAELRAMWLWKAVGKENPQAPIELARMYAQGKGIVRNCEQAQVLLRSAAKDGSEEAKLSLQQILLQGGCSTR